VNLVLIKRLKLIIRVISLNLKDPWFMQWCSYVFILLMFHYCSVKYKIMHFFRSIILNDLL